MIFGKGECRRTGRTSNENLTKNAKIAAFWQGSFILGWHTNAENGETKNLSKKL